MYVALHAKYRHSCQVLMKLEFSQHILENSQVSDFMNIHLVGAELFHADGQKNRQT